MAQQQTTEAAPSAESNTTTQTIDPRSFEARAAKAEALSKLGHPDDDPAPKADDAEKKGDDKPDDDADKSTESEEKKGDDSDVETEGEDGAAGDETDDDESESEGEPDAATKLTGIADALKAGDLKEAAKLAGVPYKPLSTHGKRLNAVRRKEQSVERKLGQLDTREAEFHTKKLKLEQTYGDHERAKKLWDAGKHYAGAEAISKAFGETFASITQKVARETSDLSPEKIAELEEREAFEKRVRDFEEKKAREEKQATQSRTRAEEITALKSKLADHPVAKIDDGPELVRQGLLDLWDDKLKGFKGGLTGGQALKKAADAVVEKKRAEAIALGLVTAEPPRRTRTKKAKTETETKPDPKPEPTTTVAETETDEAAGKSKGKKRLTFEERLAIAERRTARRKGLS